MDKPEQQAENIPPQAKTSKLEFQSNGVDQHSREETWKTRVCSTPAPSESKSRLSGVLSTLSPILKYLNIQNEQSPHQSVQCASSVSCLKSTGKSAHQKSFKVSAMHSGTLLGAAHQPYCLLDECLPEMTLLDDTNNATMELTKNDLAYPQRATPTQNPYAVMCGQQSNTNSPACPPQLPETQKHKTVKSPEMKSSFIWNRLLDGNLPEITLLDISSDSEMLPGVQTSCKGAMLDLTQGETQDLPQNKTHNVALRVDIIQDKTQDMELYMMQDKTKDMLEDKTQDTVQDIELDMVQDLRQDNTQDLAQDMVPDVELDLVQDKTQDLVQDFVQDVLQDKTQDLVQDVLQDKTQDLVQDVLQDIVQEVPQDKTQDLVQDIVQDVLQDKTQYLVQDVLQDKTQDLVQDIVQEVPQDKTQDLVQDIVQDVPQDKTQDLVQDIVQDVPQDKTQELVQNKMMEVMQDGEVVVLQDKTQDVVQNVLQNRNGKASEVLHSELPEHNGSPDSTETRSLMVENPKGTVETPPALELLSGGDSCQRGDHSQPIQHRSMELSDSSILYSMDTKTNSLLLDKTLDSVPDPKFSSTPMIDLKMFNLKPFRDQDRVRAAQRKLHQDGLGKAADQVSSKIPSNIVADRKTFLPQTGSKLLWPLSKVTSQLPKTSNSGIKSTIQKKPESSQSHLPTKRRVQDSVRRPVPPEGPQGITDEQSSSSLFTRTAVFKLPASGLQRPQVRKMTKADKACGSKDLNSITNKLEDRKRPVTKEKALPLFKKQKMDAVKQQSSTEASSRTSLQPAVKQRSLLSKPQKRGCANCSVLEVQLKRKTEELEKLQQELLKYTRK